MHAVLAALLAAALLPHDGHVHAPAAAVAPPAPRLVVPGATTGSGAYTFRHLPVAIPDEMAAALVGAHGGFAHDAVADGGDGASWFTLRGVGLLRLRPALDGIDVIGGDEAFAGVNLHDTCLFRAHGNQRYLALPSDEAQRAFLATPRGDLLRTYPNPYGDGGAPFRVTAIEHVDGKLLAANGYADNVVFTTDPFGRDPDDPRVGRWEPHRFGGTGREHGRFGTAHGITRVPGTNVVTISDRAHARLESFTFDGRYVGSVHLPDGTLPCDVDHLGDLTLVGCLKGPGGSTPAPIYVLERGEIVAELNLARDLGLDEFVHIHDAAFHRVVDADGTERLYVLAYAWNPGGFAVLEQVVDPTPALER